MYCLCIRYKQGKRCQGCRSDSETFTHSRCCVTNSIQFVSDLTNMWIQLRHLCNTPGIVRNWSISIYSYCNSGSRKHSYSSKCDTVKSACLVCNKDTDTDQKNRNCCRLHTYCKTTDDGCCRSRL